MNSRILIYIVSSLILLTTAGCFTQKLIESAFYTGKYQEVVTSFLITEDKSKLVLLGEKYHYIFDADVSMVKILNSSCLPLISVYFTDLRVKKDNRITGNFTLTLASSATDEQKKSAMDVGFAYDGEKLFMEMSGKLDGIRYSATGFAGVPLSYRTNGPYYLDIVEETAELNIAGKILLTPIAVLADGVLVLGGAALMLFMGGCGGCG